jgi:uncharacterized protein YlzI (FlbEa/FlbD family)
MSTKFIKLTRGTGGEVGIPVEKIISFDRDNAVSGGQTIVYLIGGEKRFVKESPEEILALLKGGA